MNRETKPRHRRRCVPPPGYSTISALAEAGVLARELVLNSSAAGDRSLRRWNDLAKAINYIRDLDGEAYMAFGGERDVLFEMHRIAHRQFPWQLKAGVNPLMRALKVFGSPFVEPILIRELGLTMRQVLLIGIAMTGHFQKTAFLSNYDCSTLGIPQHAALAFFARLTAPIDDLRALSVARRSG